jgi:hypothetical protein
MAAWVAVIAVSVLEAATLSAISYGISAALPPEPPKPIFYAGSDDTLDP